MKILRLLRGVVAALAGYMVIAAGTTFTFELSPRGNDYGAPIAQLFAGTVGAFLSGLAGGLIAATLGVRRPLTHAAAVIVFVAAETIWLLTAVARTKPLWFDAMGSGTLMIGALVGGLLYRRLHRECQHL